MECADGQVEKCKEIKELFSLVSSDNNSYIELGKALGTRLQIRTFQLRRNPKLYEMCKKDSDDAIKEFNDIEDKERQYLYRVQLETEHGDYNEVLRYLKMALELPAEASMKAMCCEIENRSEFYLCAYVRLMSESAGKRDLSEEMYLDLSRTSCIQDVDKKDRLYHPYEIILWKYACYCAKNGMANAASKYYEKAVNACCETDDITLNVIGMGILFEEHAFIIANNAKELTAHNRGMIKKWNKLKAIDNQDILGTLFSEIDFSSTDSDYYKELSQRITY